MPWVGSTASPHPGPPLPATPPSPPLTYGPGEAEGEADGVAEGGVGAARPVGDAEGVGAEHGGDGAAVGAGRLGGHAGLVVLEADAEEGLAVALLQPGAAGAAPPAAVAVAEEPLLVDELLQLQLEHPGAGHLAGTGTGAVSPRSGPVPRRLPPARCPPPQPLWGPPEGASGSPSPRPLVPPHVPGGGRAAPRGGRAPAGTGLPWWRGSSGALAFLPLVLSAGGGERGKCLSGEIKEK